MFRDIEVGDLVLVPKNVRLVRMGGWRSFKVPAKVERVTKTQFVAGGDRFNKERGRLIGSDGFCNATVYAETEDQAAQYKAMKEQQGAIRDLLSEIYKIDNFRITKDMPGSKAKEATKRAKALLALLVKEQEEG
jgi:hypothetical protein